MDAAYLAVLPDDAVPVLAEALPHLSGDDAHRVRWLLRDRRRELAREPAYATPFSWNLGRERARDALTTVPD